jgi:hypothetical protein
MLFVGSAPIPPPLIALDLIQIFPSSFANSENDFFKSSISEINIFFGTLIPDLANLLYVFHLSTHVSTVECFGKNVFVP